MLRLTSTSGRGLSAARGNDSPRSLILLAVVSLVWSVAGGTARADDWPQFLGSERTGVSAETGLLNEWPADGLKEVWRVPGGVGMSGLAIKGGKLVTLVQREGQQWLVAHDANSGKPIWQTPLAPEYANPMGDGPRGTPVVVGDRVLAFTGEGILAAVDFANGKVIWSHNTMAELNGTEADYGMACSPLVVGEQVLVTVGAPGATVAAWNVKTGKLAWKAGDDPAGYSSPALLNLAGTSQVVVASGSSILGLRPQSGDVLWRYPFETNYQCNIATPLAVEGRLFVSAAENHGSVLLDVTPQGKSFDLREVWTSFGAKSVLRSEWQTAVLLDGYLYGMDNLGAAGPITHLTCIDAATGERAWQKARFGKGNLIAADGKLWITTMAGELVVVRATPDKYQELGRAVVLESTRQAPALADGRLYLRDDAEIVCLDVRRPDPSQ